MRVIQTPKFYLESSTSINNLPIGSRLTSRLGEIIIISAIAVLTLVAASLGIGLGLELRR